MVFMERCLILSELNVNSPSSLYSRWTPTSRTPRGWPVDIVAATSVGTTCGQVGERVSDTDFYTDACPQVPHTYPPPDHTTPVKTPCGAEL